MIISITQGSSQGSNEPVHHIFSKKDGKDQETIQSSTTPDPGYHMGK